MITSFRVVNADYGKDRCLKRNFPSGLMLETHPEANLVVGPNGLGKTAFLRMLATSLEFERTYKRTGMSHFWNSYFSPTPESIVSELKNARLIDGLYELPFVFYTSNEFTDLCGRFGIEWTNKEVEDPERKRQGLLATTRAITPEDREKILSLENMLKENNDGNAWGFIKPAIGGSGPIHHMDFEFPIDRTEYIERSEHTSRFMKFKATQKSREHFFGEVISPGVTLYNKLCNFLEIFVPDFFTNHIIDAWVEKDYSPDARMKNAFRLVPEFPVYKVAPDSRLCVFMDEPTTFLDPVNALRFQKKIFGMLDVYRERLQLFIATNDTALTNSFEGRCRYINLYEQPAVSSTTFDPKKYTEATAFEEYRIREAPKVQIRIIGNADEV